MNHFRRNDSTVQAGTLTHTKAADYTGVGLSSKPMPVVLPMSRFGVPKPDFDFLPTKLCQ